MSELSAGKPVCQRLPVGTVFAIPPRGRKRHYGLFTANEGFLNALLRHSTVREVHLFVRDTDIEEVKASWHPIVQEISRPFTLRTFPIWALPDCMASTDYAAMHWGDPMIHTITELRNAFARRAFPVTGITHSLVGDHRNTNYAHLAFSDVRPYDAVICSSQACARALRRILEISQIQSGPEGTVPRPFSAQLPVIPLGVEMEAHGGFGKSEARRKLGLPPDHAIILCLARFAPITKMDLHPCLLALQRLIRENGHERILLVAAGSVDKSDVYFEVMVSRIKALGLTNHVLMKADFPAEEKGLLLAAADVFLSPSDNLQESFGIAPVEAMLAGLPCVLSNWNGYRELVRDGETGFLIPTYSSDLDAIFVPRTLIRPSERRFYMAQATAVDISRMTQTLSQLLRDEALRRRIGEAARAAARAQFTWIEIIRKYEDLWQQLHESIPDDEPARLRKPFLRGQSLDSIFEHYASGRLEGAFAVRTSDRGVRVIENRETPGCYSTLSKLIDLRLVRAILHAARGTRSVDDLRRSLPGTSPLLEFNLLWMLKHDFLEAAD